MPDVVLNLPRKIAESTGRFPPTPIDHIVANEMRVIELGEPPAANANTATMRSVMLKEILQVCEMVLRVDT